MVTYKGFSTKNWRSNSSNFLITDIELVKRDLLNHIFTEKGSRLMMPNWGTRIPALTFEQNDEYTRSIIEEDITAVIKADPRVKLVSLDITSLSSNNAIIASVVLHYIEFNVTDNLNIEVPLK